MCRFLMVKSRSFIQPAEILTKFAEMARESKALNGDWQGDGWGISYLSKSKLWKIHKSTDPIWEDAHSFKHFYESNLFLVHARSSSFQSHKRVLAYNQPFISEPYSFVFNGLVKKVSFPYPVSGDIGSQKLWTILQGILKQYPPEESLALLESLVKKRSQEVQALNIGLCDRERIYAFCQYSDHPEYYSLQVHDFPELTMISSEPLDGFNFIPISSNKVHIF